MRKRPNRLYLDIPLVLFALASASTVRADDAPFDYFSNSWNVVGLKDYRDAARVTPDNSILLAEKGTLRLRFGRELTPLSRRQTKTALEGWLPVMLLSAADGSVRYDFKFWATPLPSVKDWRKAFDWPTEGENFLVWAVVTVTNAGTQPAEAKLTADDPAGHKENAWNLAPGASDEAVIRVPFKAVTNPAAFDREDPKVWLQRTVDYWKNTVTGAARIEVPCKKATEALLAAHVCQLIASDHGELHGGEGFYDDFYIRDGGYQLMELEEAGLSDTAARAIESYFRCQRPDGRFESQPNQFDANGQAVWTLWQYWKIAGDRAWLARVYPRMRKAADWTAKARRQAPAESPYAGLLPPTVADGEFLWEGKHHIVGYDLWNLRGLLCAADAAGTLGKTAEADELLKEADSYRSAIDAAWKRLGMAYFPPSWEKAGTHWGNTETLWPTPIFSPDDPRVAALIDEVRHRYGGGYVEGTIRWIGPSDWAGAIHPYMGAYTTMADLVRGKDEQVVEDFYWYLLHSTAAHAFPEGILFKTRTAWSDTIPHVTGASNYAVMLRHMLVHEAGDELHLLRAVPDWWLAEGREIRCERLPTHFGPMNLLVQGRKHGVEITLNPPKRNPPKRIVLHLPQSRPPAAASTAPKSCRVPISRSNGIFPRLSTPTATQLRRPNRPRRTTRSDHHETTRISENRDWGLGRLGDIQRAAAFGLRRQCPQQPHQRRSHRAGKPKPGRSAGLFGTGRRANRGGLRRQHREPRIPDAEAVPRPQAGAGRRERLLCQEDRAGGYKGCDAYNDFREVLGRADVDAVAIIVPDHWHAIITVMAAKAGKDIYCEKPLSLTIRQGQEMVKAVRQHERILQTGSQWRSNDAARRACELVRNGRIGQVRRIVTEVAENNFQSPGPGWKPMPVPEGFDYETWLGPAPWAPYHKDRCLLSFPLHSRLFGRTDDELRLPLAMIWPNGPSAPTAADQSSSRTWAVGGPCPAACSPPPRRSVSSRYANGVELLCQTTKRGFGARFEGTEGWVEFTAKGLQTSPASLKDTKIGPRKSTCRSASRTVPKKRAMHSDSHNHVRNFLDSVKSRQDPIEPVEVGHRTASLCHLGNIAMKLHRKIRWDPKEEQILGDDEAAAMLSRPMRAPWQL